MAVAVEPRGYSVVSDAPRLSAKYRKTRPTDRSSSPYAMASPVGLKDQFDIAFANDTDYDRHGIVTRSVGLMNPNHFINAESFVSQEHLERIQAETQRIVDAALA